MSDVTLRVGPSQRNAVGISQRNASSVRTEARTPSPTSVGLDNLSIATQPPVEPADDRRRADGPFLFLASAHAFRGFGGCSLPPFRLNFVVLHDSGNRFTAGLVIA